MKKNREEDSPYYDKVYADSLGKNGEYAKLPKDCVYAKLWERTLHHICVTERIFDLGCGVGQFENLALEYGDKIVRAIDFSKVAIDNAKKINPSIADVFSVQNLMSKETYAFNDYDVVVMLEVLEHINNDLFIFQNIPSGKKIIFSVPSFMCKAHVRNFPYLKDVQNRYETYLHFITTEKIIHSVRGDKYIWLVVAKKI
jgi:SAM-dependent methyltransferase